MLRLVKRPKSPNWIMRGAIRPHDGAGAGADDRVCQIIRTARARGEKRGLTREEETLYDALADNESAREVMGEPALRSSRTSW